MPTQAEYAHWLTSLDDILVLTNNTGIIATTAALRQDILKAKRDEVVIPAPTEMFHAGPPGTKDKLPKIKPIPGKRVKTGSIDCPTCLVKAGEPCVMMSTRGPSGTPTGAPKEGYHITRTRRAQGR